MKLFEIPIYAFDKKGLQDRISRWKIDNFGTNPEFADSIKNERKQYEYNHIVGFIEIYLDNDNIFLDYTYHISSVVHLRQLMDNI